MSIILAIHNAVNEQGESGLRWCMVCQSTKHIHRRMCRYIYRMRPFHPFMYLLLLPIYIIFRTQIYTWMWLILTV